MTLVTTNGKPHIPHLSLSTHENWPSSLGRSVWIEGLQQVINFHMDWVTASSPKGFLKRIYSTPHTIHVFENVGQQSYFFSMSILCHVFRFSFLMIKVEPGLYKKVWYHRCPWPARSRHSPVLAECPHPRVPETNNTNHDTHCCLHVMSEVHCMGKPPTHIEKCIYLYTYICIGTIHTHSA